MSMLTMKGVLVNVYKSPKKVLDDGKETGGLHKIQILGDIPQESGEVRKELVSLTAHNVDRFRGHEGTEVTIPVGVFAPSKGNIIYYIPKGM